MSCSQQLSQYKEFLIESRLSEQTRRAYLSRVTKYLQYLEHEFQLDLDLLHVHESLERYKNYMRTTVKSAPSSINSSLTAIKHFQQFLRAPVSYIEREPVSAKAVQALTLVQQQHLVKVVERVHPKERALILLILYTGMRLGECANACVQDILLGESSGRMQIRNLRSPRAVPLNAAVRAALLEWLAVRRDHYAGSEGPLFINRYGQRISGAGLDFLIRKVGRDAGFNLSASVLRDSCLRNIFVHSGDLLVVAEIGGHQNLDSAKRYASSC